MRVHPNLEIAHDLWQAIAAGDAHALSNVLSEKCTWHMPGRSPLAGQHEGIGEITTFIARVGELSDELVAELRDVFVSDRGAVLHYTLSAQRGSQQLETEHLFRVRIEHEVVTEGVFAPVDQESYDRFWQLQ